MGQLALDLGQTYINEHHRKYVEWKRDNPAAFRLLERFALEASARGRKFSTRALLHRARWEAKMNWLFDEGGFKLNDHHSPYLARDLVERYPEMGPLIECRRITVDEKFVEPNREPG